MTELRDPREGIGLHCLYCGRWEVPPNRKLDNWTCGYCYSGFLSIAMLTNLIPRDVVGEIVSTKEKRKRDRPCVVCQKPMEQVGLTKNGNHIELELCRGCQTCWFEAGAFTKFSRILGPDQVFLLKKLREPKAVGVRAPKSVPVASDPLPRVIPWASLGIFVVSTVMSSLALKSPELSDRYGFIPARPLRDGGLNWITSAFFNSGYEIHALFVFLIAGLFAEKELRSFNLLILFGVTAILSRVPYLALTPAAVTPVTGAGPGFFALFTYVLLAAPYAEYLFPKDRWKDPKGAMGWVGIVVFLFFIVFVLFNVGSQVLNGLGDSRAEMVIPIIGRLPPREALWGYGVGAAMGFFAYLRAQTDKNAAASLRPKP